MTLEPGTYHIMSPALSRGDVIGLGKEDILGPKKVVSIPQSVALSTKWHVEEVGDLRYKLTIDNHHAAIRDNKVYAFSSPEPPAEEWMITYAELQKSYMVMKGSNPEEGWVVPGEQAQIEIRPLKVLTSFPPQYPSNQLFQFVKA